MKRNSARFNGYGVVSLRYEIVPTNTLDQISTDERTQIWVGLHHDMVGNCSRLHYYRAHRVVMA